MFAAVVAIGEVRVHSSFFSSLTGHDEAIKYAERMPGVVCVEEIGKGVIWERADCSDCAG